MKRFEDFSIQTQQALESVRQNFWWDWCSDYTITELQAIFEDIKTPNSIAYAASFHGNHMRGYVVAKGVSRLERYEAWNFVSMKHIWLEDFLKELRSK